MKYSFILFLFALFCLSFIFGKEGISLDVNSKEKESIFDSYSLGTRGEKKI